MGKRGDWMGLTLPYGGVLGNDYLDICANLQVKNIRCGFPEIKDLGATVGAFDTTDITAEVDAVHAAGFGYCFSFLSLPTECTGTTAGKRFGTTSTHWGKTASRAALVATALMDAKRAHGKDVWLEIIQEPNIPAFNEDDQPASDWAHVLKRCIDAVRAAEPALPIIAGSIANRGDINNLSDPDVVDHWDGPNFLADTLAAEPTLKTTSAPDYWGYHPYCGTSDPSMLTQGWGMKQMVAFGAVLAFNGAKRPGGGAPLVCVTEFGSIRTRTITGTWTTSTSSKTVSVSSIVSGSGIIAGDSHVLGEVGATLSGTGLASGSSITTRNSSTSVVLDKFPTSTATSSRTMTVSRDAWQAEHLIRQLHAHDLFRKDGWLAGPEFTMEELGTEKSLVKSAGAHDPFAAGFAYEFAALTEPEPTPVDPPPSDPATEISYKIEIGTPPVAARSSGTWVVSDAGTRDKLNNGKVLADAYAWHEITGDVQSFDIVRGSRDGWDRTEVGTASVVVRNDRQDRGTAGDYWAGNWSGPMFPYLGPRARLRISADDKPLFCGDLTGMPVTDVRDNVVYTTFTAADFLAFLNKTIRYKPEKEHNAQQRISRILEKAGVRERGEHEFLFPGIYTYQANATQEGTALDMCADIATAETGMFYANDTTYVFLNREHLEDPGALMTWSDDPAKPLNYSGLVRNSRFDHIANTVTVRPLQPDPVPHLRSEKASDDQEDLARSAHDDLSCNLYGDSRVEYTLPLASLLDCQVCANQILADNKNPVYQVEQITIPTARYSKSDRVAYIYQEVGHVVNIERTAPGDTAIDQNCVIVGIEHHVSEAGRQFETVFNLRAQK